MRHLTSFPLKCSAMQSYGKHAWLVPLSCSTIARPQPRKSLSLSRTHRRRSSPLSLAAVAACAMLRLQRCLAARLLSSTCAARISPLHRFLSASAAAPAVSPNPSFAVEEYLVETCGLTRAQAVKASPKLWRLKSPTNPDAVLAFLARLGLSGADVAALVAKDPNFLCADVDETLSPIVAGLTGLGLSRSEIARLVPLTCHFFRTRSIVSKLSYYMPLFGSNEKLFRVLKNSQNLLSNSLERMVKPNVAFLQECGLDACRIASLAVYVRWILNTKPERVQAMAARAEAIGVPRGSGMFRQALQAVALLTEEKIAVKVERLKNTFRWSDAEVGIALRKFPLLLGMSKEMLQSKSEFLISEVGLEPAYVAQRPVMLGLRLEGRLRPRYYVLEFLKRNGIIDRERGYFSAVMLTEKDFVEKYISTHKEAAPHLAEDYADASSGQLPSRFRFA